MSNRNHRSHYEITDNSGICFQVGPHADLDGADLRGMNLSNSNFSGATLKGADLSFADLRDCDFTAADLGLGEYSPVTLDWAVLIGCNFEFADLTGASMYEAEVSEANFFYACLEGVNLFGADLTNTNFSYAQLERADLRSAITKNAKFDHATNFIGQTNEQWLRLGLLTVEEIDTFYAIILEKLKNERKINGKD